MNTILIFGIVLAIIGILMGRENMAGIPVLLAAAIFIYLSAERALWREIREQILKEEKESLDGGES